MNPFEKLDVICLSIVWLALTAFMALVAICACYELIHGELYGFPKSQPTRVELVQPEKS